MEAHVPWAQDKNQAPVHIEIGKSATEILAEGYLTAILKTSGVRTVGVMLDADTSPKGRYLSVRSICLGMFPDLPLELPKTGLIAVNDARIRLGVWIMPDNSSDGSLEAFLKYLVPKDAIELWNHATASAAAARAMGAECRDAHIEKSNLFTWLAWQDPPGQKPGLALTKRVLDPLSPGAASFVKWFRELYGL